MHARSREPLVHPGIKIAKWMLFLFISKKTRTTADPQNGQLSLANPWFFAVLLVGRDVLQL